MQVSRWGNSLAIRLPAVVVKALELHEGDDIEVRVAQEHVFEINRKSSPETLLSRLRRFRGRLPQDFIFDRDDAHSRG